MFPGILTKEMFDRWNKISWIACKLKLSSTFVNGVTTQYTMATRNTSGFILKILPGLSGSKQIIGQRQRVSQNYTYLHNKNTFHEH